MSSYYNFATDIRPLGDLNAVLRLKLSKSYTLNISTVFKSYVYEADSVGAVPHESEHVTYWQQGKFGRFTGLSQNLSYTLNNEKVMNFFKRLRGEKVDKKDKKKKSDDDDDEWETAAESNIDKDMEKAKQAR